MESDVEMPVVRRAERAGWFVRKLRWIGVDGAPDRFFAKKTERCKCCGRSGRVVLIEFKDEGEPARLSQLDEHDQLRKAGVEVHLCDRADDALRILGIIPR